MTAVVRVQVPPRAPFSFHLVLSSRAYSRWEAVPQGNEPRSRGHLRGSYGVGMNILFWIIAIIAVVLLIVGGIVEAVRFLLWVGIALLLLAVIAWALRKISGSKR